MELVKDFASEVTIAYMGEFTRPENAAMVSILKIPMRKFTWDLLQPNTVVATVDAQPSFFKGDDRLRFDVIVDHHPLSDLGEPKFADVRPDVRVDGDDLHRVLPGRRHPDVEEDRHGAVLRPQGRHRQPHPQRQRRRRRRLPLPADADRREHGADHRAVAAAGRDARLFRDRHRQQRRSSARWRFAYLGTISNPDMCVPRGRFLHQADGHQLGGAWRAARATRVVVVFPLGRLPQARGPPGGGARIMDYGSAGRPIARWRRAELELSRLQAELREPSDVAIEDWLLKAPGHQAEDPGPPDLPPLPQKAPVQNPQR
jgi:hypothetical protein